MTDKETQEKTVSDGKETITFQLGNKVRRLYPDTMGTFNVDGIYTIDGILPNEPTPENSMIRVDGLNFWFDAAGFCLVDK